MRLSHVPVLLVLAASLAACNRAEQTMDAGVDAASDAIGAMEPDTGPAGAAEAIPPSGDARMDGYAGLDFGMTPEEAVEAWSGNPLQPAGPVDDPMACHHLGPAGQDAPAQLAFMFEDGLFVRYSVESPEITAPGGGRVGMERAALEGLYGGRLAAAPHKYVEGGRVLMSPADKGVLPTRLYFELDPDGRVTSWRVGMDPQVGYVEGCG